MSHFYNFIAGKWVPADSGASYECANPADLSDIIGHFPASGASDVARAIEGLVDQQKLWSQTDPDARAVILEKAAHLILERVDALAADLTREEGKPLSASTMEWRRTAQNFRFYAGEALRTRGETFPVAAGGKVMSLRVPVGIVAVITPWNFPVSLPSRKIGPALATGNCVLFKPSEVSPTVGQRIVEILLEAGLPKDVIALIHGFGRDVGPAICESEQVGAITFTGSYETGALIHQMAGPGKRLQLEMGGKNPCVVLGDADPKNAANIIAQGAFNLTGQACTATSRAYIHSAVYEETLAALVDKAKAHVVGNGAVPGTTMGPLATAAQREKFQRMLRVAAEENLNMVFGEEMMDGDLPSSGYFVCPTIFEGVPSRSALMQEEIFGPLVCVQRVDSYEEAVERANDSLYGLAASIVTGDASNMLRFADDIEAGIVKVNSATGGVALSAPFGGFKRSSNQTYKEQAGHGVMDFYLSTKSIYLQA